MSVAVRRLSEISAGESVYIKLVRGKGAFRQRISEMGFVKGKKITVVRNAPLNDPIEFSIMGYNISLRRHEASLIDVTYEYAPVIREEELFTEPFSVKKAESRPSKTIRVAMVGNPNSGKTTLFNFASRSHEHVGNYAGVTVDSKTSTFTFNETQIELTDLPGTYSISAYSPEELYVRNFILNEKPDVVINVLDAANLERNLFLTTQLIDMKVKVVVALNMFDELFSHRDRFDYDNLGKMLGIPFVPTIGARGKGIHKLLRKVIEVYSGKEPHQRSVQINYGFEPEAAINEIIPLLPDQEPALKNMSRRFIALRLLVKDHTIQQMLGKGKKAKEVIQASQNESERIEGILGDTIDSIFTDARYGFISGALKETFKPGTEDRHKISDSIDHMLTNRYLGFPIFLFFMWVMFTATFNLGAFPQQWIENGISFISLFLDSVMTEGSFKRLLIDGVIGGVGGVIVFLPNIVILFFFISIMEDTGYMARAAFITDKLMHKIGLHGKSFIPLIMGFGCNVPAVMATRTIENRSNRLMTMLINPFMSCSARLPVYILLIGAVFPDNKGTLLFGIYMTGILVAILAALVFKNTLFKTSDAPFVMELPPYRVPTARSITRHMWMKASQYLKKMGGIIMVASIIIWALGHYPQTKPVSPASQILIQNSNHENSYIASIGKFIEPAIQPLGFDWRMGISLITGIAAKEIVVSTMGVVYQNDRKNLSLEEKIQSAKYTHGKWEGQTVFTPLATISFLIFTLLYFPCLPTITAIYNESGALKWALFSIVFTTAIAWILSFIVYQTGMLFL